MSDTFIGVDVSGLEELLAKLESLPPEVQDEAVQNVNKYLLNVLKLYPPYTYVPYRTAYGKWFSEKQRRYVMAKISQGEITPGMPNRSQTFSRNWKIVGYGKNSIIANETPYGHHLMGDSTQARLPKKAGWKTIGEVIKNRMDEIIRRADAGVKNAMRKLGL